MNPKTRASKRILVQKLVNLILHCSGKHMEIKHHFIKNYFQKMSLDLNFMSKGNELGDIYTKPLPQDKLVHMRNLVDIHSICIQNHVCAKTCASKHISVQKLKRSLDLNFTSNENKLDDIYTKPLRQDKLVHMRNFV
ncbi:hypothetical protein CR513_44814, partial [Mucuna pruriens]